MHCAARQGGVMWLLLSVMVGFQYVWSAEDENLGPFRMIKQWQKISYDTKCLQNPYSVLYKSSKNRISGIKIFRNLIYLSIPRTDPGVPVTLASIPLHSGNKSPKLKPFPSWELQQTGNCDNLVNVYGFEIDVAGRMWVLDNGKPKCPPKLIIFDLNTIDFVQMGKKTNEQECKTSVRTIRVHDFPEEVVQSGNYLLNDLVVDSNGWFAYITDSGEEDPGLIVYSWKENKSWKVRSPVMSGQGTGLLGRPTGGGNINGIALSPRGGHRVVYFCPLDSLSLYSVPAEVLQGGNVTESADAITEVGKKTSISGGMMMDSEGVLYFGLLSLHALGTWQSATTNMTDNVNILANSSTFTWIDSFGFDNMGNLFFTTDRDQSSAHLNDSTMRIFQGQVRARSYMFPPLNPLTWRP